MAILGNYDTVREIGSDALGVVYAARKKGETGEPRFALKLRRPVRLFDDPDDPSPRAKPDGGPDPQVLAFLASVASQRKLAESAGPQGAWAQVHDAGLLPDGSAFVVTDLASIGSFRRLARGRVTVDAPTVARLIGAVIDGLKSAEATGKRGHGNLKPTNVLLSGADLSTARVLLTDPVADDRADAARDRLADLRCIGDLIVLLVTHETKRGGWPVAPSPAWTRLGRSSGRWLDLVNRLLDPNDQADRPSLEELGQTIAALAPPPSRNRPFYIAGAAVAAVLALSLAVWWFGFHRSGLQLNTEQQTEFRKDPKTCQTEWEAYCKEYNSLRQLIESLDQPADRKLGLQGLRADVYSKNELDLKVLRDAQGEIHSANREPYSIAEKSKGAAPGELVNQFPGNLRVICDDGVAATREGLNSLKKVRELLLSGWPRAASIAASERTFRDLGWTPPADELHALLQRLDPASADVVGGVDEVIAESAALQPVRTSMDALKVSGETLAARGDPVLAAFEPATRKAVAERLSTASAASGGAVPLLAGALSESVDLAAKLVASSEPARLCRDDLARDAEYVALESRVKSAGVPPISVFSDAWMKLADKYRPLREPDPRAQWKAADEIKQIRGLAAELDKRPVPIPLSPEEGAQLVRLDSDAQALAGLSWCGPNKEKVERGDADLRASLRTLADAAGAKKKTQDQRRAEGVPGVKKRLATAMGLGAGLSKTEAVVQQWRDALAATVDTGNFDTKDEEAAALEKAVRDSLAGFTVAPGNAAGAANDWAAELARIVGAKVDDQAAAQFQKLRSPPSPAEIKSAADRATESQYGFSTAVKAIETDMRLVEKALGAGYVLTDPAPAAKSADQALARVEKSVGYQDKDVQQAIRPMVDRAKAGSVIAGKSDTAELVRLVSSAVAAAPEQTLAAVARLGELSPAWPKTTDALASAALLAEPARKAAGSLADEARRTEANARIDAAMSRLWTGFASGAATTEAMNAALDTMEKFSVKEAQLDPRLRYNALLRAARAELAKGGLNDQAAKAKVSDLASRIEGLGLRDAGPGAITRRLRDIAKDETPVFDPQASGPGLAGWRASQVRQEGPFEFVDYTKDGVTLQFVRLGEPGSPDTMYLATTEVSVQMFAAMVAAGDRTILADIMQPPEDNIFCSWKLSGTSVTAAPIWAKPTPSLTAGLFKPGLKADAPSLSVPIQSLSVRAAVYACGLTHCRLPTAEEWKKAYEVFLQNRPPAGARLRGTAFNEQRDYVSKGDGQNIAAPWPDLNISYAADGTPVNGKAESGSAASSSLLFDPVGSGDGPVHNLVGNAAEMVFAKKQKFDDAAVRGVFRAKDSLEKFVDDSWPDFAAIGGSCLSPPRVPVEKEYPIGTATGDQYFGWSDLGFRAAFSASGKMPLDRQAAEALAKANYILSAPGQ